MPDTITRIPLEAIVREDLSRKAPLRLVESVNSEEDGDGLTLDGIGAVFNSVTVVDSWEGTFEEVIAPGAFKRTLRETRPKMQFDHGMHPVIGSIPIGRFEDGYPQETDEGLHVRGRLHDNWMTIPVRDAIGSGSVDGMSFRFSIVNETWHSAEGRSSTNPGKKLPNATDDDREAILRMIFYPPEEGLLRRVLKEVKLREVGPVVWPQYTDTSVSVRSRVTIDLADPASLRDRETQKTLARALFMAEQVRTASDDGPQSSDSPDVHPAPAEVIEETEEVTEVTETVEVEGPEVSEASPGEHPTDARSVDESRLNTLFARMDAVTLASDNTRHMLFNDFPEDGDNA